MPVHRLQDAASDALARSLADRELLVVALCAAWCDTCAEFFEAFEVLAREHDGATFVWLDIEDDASIVGDIDVENFPTLAIFRNGRPQHFGVSLPQAGVVRRVLASLTAASSAIEVDDAVRRLPRTLARRTQPADQRPSNASTN